MSSYFGKTSGFGAAAGLCKKKSIGILRPPEISFSGVQVGWCAGVVFEG